jgi:hypothetical protein
MNKQEFKKILTELIKLKKDEMALQSALKKFDPDSFFSLERYETLVVDTLTLAMNDTNAWIAYWLYDCDCGKDIKAVKIMGKNVPLKTMDNLWNVLTMKKDGYE